MTPSGLARPAPVARPWVPAWAAVAVALGAVALLGARLDPVAIDWQPARAGAEPWRALTAVGVHYSAMHLGANLAGLALTAAFGVAAEVPARVAAAWLAAWPLTQLALWLAPGLTHFGGLSGVLHAGVAAVAVWLVVRGADARRAIGAAVALGCVAKLAIEAPWAAPLLRHPDGWDIATAPIAHLSGVVAGAACGLVAACLPFAGRTSAHG